MTIAQGCSLDRERVRRHGERVGPHLDAQAHGWACAHSRLDRVEN